MIYLSADQINAIWSYPDFILQLQKAFQSEIVAPERNHFSYRSGQGEQESTLLIMPAWAHESYVGVKIVTVSPHNGALDLPSIQGHYSLIDAQNGLMKAQIDAKALTVKRTAATSAMASQYLSREDSKTLLMVGTGALCPELIKAHCAIRPIEKVFIWGRSPEKVEEQALQFRDQSFEVMGIQSIEEGVRLADIISVATLSPTPLINGNWLGPGQHLDLVGSYKPDMREADDACLTKSSIYIDSKSALKESGDLVIPLSNGTLKVDDIKSTLFEMTASKESKRRSQEEITLFKSVGHALEDLAAAIYLLQTSDYE